ncbi:MAG: 5'/3'-nucleotidase SurE [Alphaproteobacteria bacterium]|nr:5'/3'-nucleotidase SurE [Alphaproteobacteria bacterium]
MSRAVPDLSRARLLLSNDDGIHAPGLAVLERVAASLSDDVWTIAPEVNHSGAGHSLTLKRPLHVRRITERRIHVDGTPTDCVLLAVNKVLADHKPDLVLSGVNLGSNVAEDVTYSGTIAAAMEATLLGLPAVALSLDVGIGQAPRWDTVEAHCAEIVRTVVKQALPPGVLISVNFPDCGPDEVKGVKVTTQGFHQVRSNVVEAKDPYENPVYWVGMQVRESELDPNSDVAAVEKGYISVTPIHMEMTDFATLEQLKQLF